MPTIYRRSERIKELNGRVGNGVAVVAHTPTDVLALEGLVDSVADLPGDPLANLYRVLANAGRSPETWPLTAPADLDNEGFPKNLESLERRDPRIASLRVSLIKAREIWFNQGDDVDQLSLALMLPRPGRRARIDSNRPALVLDYGSIRARVLTVGGKLRDFGVALFPVARSKRRANVVEALRDNASGDVRLQRLETVQPDDLNGKTGVVVFLHGLMSTDVGLFDQFVSAFNSPNNPHSLLLVSWPHDTLARIAVNARELSVIIEKKLGGLSLPVAFVCHSRGGLVARRTAVELMEIDRDRWQPRLPGLVTFGTPHEGAALAENGDELLGKLVLAGAVASRAGLVPLVDALWSVKDHRKLAGVSDLRPPTDEDAFLYKLQYAESRIVKKAGGVPLRLYAVGGNVKVDGFRGLLTRRYFGGDAHDLIVTLASATPAAAEQRAETTCNHFDYFRENQIGGNAAKDAITFLTGLLAPPQSQPATPAETKTLPEKAKPISYDPAKVAAPKAALGAADTRQVK